METGNVIKDNIRAVLMLASGSYDEGLAMLRSAVQKRHSRAACDKTRTSREPANPDIAFATIPCGMERTQSFGLNSLAVNPFLVFDRAFYLVGWAGDELANDVIDIILVYNTGLSFHLLAVSSAHNRGSNFEMALNIYMSALQARINKTTDDKATPDIVGYITIAILNNLCSIYSHFLQKDQLDSFLHRCGAGFCSSRT